MADLSKQISKDFAYCEDTISRQAAVDAIYHYEGWQCSECKCIVEEEREPLWNFCPSCGADMRGEQDGRDN